MHTLIVQWPDHCFPNAADAAHVATRALSDASKALGINEPTVRDADTRPQVTPLCAECDCSIVFVPKSGFGCLGEWQHRDANRQHTGPSHQPRPKVFIDPPIKEKENA